MEKKIYLIPTTTVVMLSQKDGILYTGSASGEKVFGNGGKTNGTSVTEGDTKSSGSWNVWSDDDE